MFYEASKCVYLFCTSYEIFFHIGCAHASFLCYCLVLMSSLSLSLSLSTLIKHTQYTSFVYSRDESPMCLSRIQMTSNLHVDNFILIISFYIFLRVEYLDIIGYFVCCTILIKIRIFEYLDPLSPNV